MLIYRPSNWTLVVVGYFLLIGICAFPPTLGAGYLLQLDMLFAPRGSYLDFVIAEKGPLYYGRLPFVVMLDTVTLFVEDWIVQRAILIGIVAGSGLSLFKALDQMDMIPRIFGGTLYAVNPFIYERLLAGQWYVALGYVFLPLAVISYYQFIRRNRARPTAAVVWTTAVAIFDPHIAVVLALVGAFLLGFVILADGWQAVRRTMWFAVLAIVVNAFWILPAVYGLMTGDTPLEAIGTDDLLVFQTQGVILDNVPLSVTMMYGFWRGGYTYPFDIVPLLLIIAIFAGMFVLAAYGWMTRPDPLRNGLTVAAIVAGVLAVGMATTSTGFLASVFIETPIGAGMRETGKFVVLIVLAYSILGARGLATLLERDLEIDSLTFRTPNRDQISSLVLVVIILLLPLAYTFPMVIGFWGGFSPTEYPADWHEAADVIETNHDERILVLPWHQYVYIEWADRTVANPAPLFFEGDVVSSHDAGLGTGSLATDPMRTEIHAILDEDDNFASASAELGVGYVVLLKEADFQSYQPMYDDPSMQLRFDSGTIAVFQNDAFANAPPAEEWPPSHSIVPLWTILLGSGMSIVGVCAVHWESRMTS